MRKLYSIFLLVAIAIVIQSCDFLDVVPKNNPNYKSVFRSRSGAKKALHGLYSYIPDYSFPRYDISVATDGFSWPPGYSTGAFRQKSYWANNFGASSGDFDFWGTTGYHALNLYGGIRYCFSFIKNIDNVPDMTNREKEQWKAQANFLIAYYYFLLLKNYGPVPLISNEVPFKSTNFPKRASVDSTVSFIIKYLNKAIPDLLAQYPPNDYGKVTSVAAKAIKAKVLVFAASPLFNGEAPKMYEDLTGPDGKHLFPEKPDPSKWKKALDAANSAIDAAHAARKKLYEYTGSKPTAWDTWTKKDQAIASNIFKVVKKWNEELIWGYTMDVNSSSWQHYSYRNCVSPVRALNSLEITIEAVERFYTQDGLPIDVDPNYDYKDRYKVKSGDSTAYLNRDRSPRFYATVAYDRGEFYMNGKTLGVRTRKGDMQGLVKDINDGGSTGYFLQKFTNPKTVLTCNEQRYEPYPFPIIRLAGLYLLDAEAYNEVHGALSGKALDYFNDVRKRAGVPTLADSWAKVGGVPTSKEKLRQIIHQERYNELAFEGYWYYDMRRWVVAKKYLDRPVHGWDVTSSTQNGFYQLQSTYENVDRKFNNRFYFLAIPISVMNINNNLVQNPGY
jgi:hypothetical protein